MCELKTIYTRQDWDIVSWDEAKWYMVLSKLFHISHELMLRCGSWGSKAILRQSRTISTRILCFWSMKQAVYNWWAVFLAYNHVINNLHTHTHTYIYQYQGKHWCNRYAKHLRYHLSSPSKYNANCYVLLWLQTKRHNSFTDNMNQFTS